MCLKRGSDSGANYAAKWVSFRCKSTARYLARQEVAVEVLERQTSCDVGIAMLSLAAEVRADRLVMGAHSHSGLRELALGGVTRTVLRDMSLPSCGRIRSRERKDKHPARQQPSQASAETISSSLHTVAPVTRRPRQ
ncbi:universal stress protein [Pseudoduganella sp. UC29_71]|uniref:universal stress protein n=1 Tax=Pseudoduganella sp. UC29_71 TaxID=3350174 RepID=UPI00366D877E